MLSIRRTLSLPLLIGVPLLVLAAGGLCSTLVARRVHADFDAALLQRAQSLAGLLKMSNSGGALEFDFSDELMPEFSSVTQPEYFELWIVGGRLIERSRSLKHRHLSRPAGGERGHAWAIIR